LLSFI